MDSNEPTQIIFEEEVSQPSAQSFQAATPKIVQWTIEHSGGYIKNEYQAIRLLVAFVVVAILFTLWMFFSGRESRPVVPSITGVPVGKTDKGLRP
jgi:hypothetical protein